MCVFFVELVLRQSHILFEHDEEGELEGFLAVQDREGRLFFADVVFVLGFVVERNLEGGAFGEKELLARGLPREEEVLPVTYFHAKVELVGQRAKQFLD